MLSLLSSSGTPALPLLLTALDQQYPEPTHQELHVLSLNPTQSHAQPRASIILNLSLTEPQFTRGDVWSCITAHINDFIVFSQECCVIHIFIPILQIMVLFSRKSKQLAQIGSLGFLTPGTIYGTLD